jgi:hypothetical protein
MTLPEGTISGNYQPVGNVEAADCVLAQEFGSDPELRTNQAIIDYVLGSERLRSLPMFVSGSLAAVLRQRRADENIVYTFQGPSAANLEENLGTYGELSQFRQQRDPTDHAQPVLITNAHNVGNILRQARLLEVDEGMIVPEGLPRNFDWRSAKHGQLWTAHPALWAMGAVPRHLLLRAKGH